MTRTRLWISALTCTFGLALAGTAAAQNGQPTAKLLRQIAVVKGFIDETLIESKALLVPGHDVTRGIYLQEFGVLFTVKASVITPENERWEKLLEDDDHDDENPEKARKKYEEREAVRQEMLKARQKNYEIGKTEIRGALLDYGGTLAGLRDNQWVGIVAFIDDDFFFEKNNSETVVFRAKVSDLRAHDQGQLNDQQIQDRVSIEEY
ncbi:MAG TPA: hypothetical protein VFP10_00770 [Candidatus Eisenbacteria bacterium]|nr:hypothetical protein [Candidatus Eisenbacteria bacterium]